MSNHELSTNVYYEHLRHYIIKRCQQRTIAKTYIAQNLLHAPSHSRYNSITHEDDKRIENSELHFDRISILIIVPPNLYDIEGIKKRAIK